MAAKRSKTSRDLLAPAKISIATWGNAYQAGMVMAEAQSVIGMRMLGMAGFWSVSPRENSEMISEKVYAATKAMTDASLATIQGKRLDEITAAGIKPYRTATRANSKRLTKRGPKAGR